MLRPLQLRIYSGVQNQKHPAAAGLLQRPGQPGELLPQQFLQQRRVLPQLGGYGSALRQVPLQALGKLSGQGHPLH